MNKILTIILTIILMIISVAIGQEFIVSNFGIRDGYYTSGTIPHTIDSVYCNNAKATIVGQDATYVEWYPSSVLAAGKYNVIFYYTGGTYEFELSIKNRPVSSGNNKPSISVNIGL